MQSVHSQSPKYNKMPNKNAIHTQYSIHFPMHGRTYASIQGTLPLYKDKTAAKTEVAGLSVSLSKWGLYIFCTKVYQGLLLEGNTVFVQSGPWLLMGLVPSQ